MSRRRWYLIVLMLLIVGISWLLRAPSTRPETTAEPEPNQADYFLKGMESISTGPDGRIQHRLVAQSLIHYPDGDTTELQQPLVEIFQQDGSHWTVQAQQGHYSNDRREMWLHGEVRIHQFGDQDTLSLETESLRLLPDSRFAETADPVLLLGTGTRLQGTGMELYGKEQRLLLLSAVRGIHYEAHP